MHRIRAAAAVLALVLLAACSVATVGTGAERSDLTVHVRAPYVELANTGSRPIYYLLAAGSPLMSWALCEEPAGCAVLAPGEQRRLHYNQIQAWEPGETDALLIRWYFVRTGDGFRRTRVRTETLRL